MKMHRVFVFSAAIAILFSSEMFAIDQIQSFDIYSSNVGALTGTGTGAAVSVQFVPVNNSQQVIDGSGQIKVLQTGVGAIVQGGSAVGTCGIFGYEQGAGFGGNQWQVLTDFFTLGSHGQNFNTDIGQNVIRIGSLGSALALQNVVGGQSQFVITPYGVNVDVRCLGIGLLDGVGGHSSSMISRGISIQHSSIR
jgi:hypothetical protein